LGVVEEVKESLLSLMIQLSARHEFWWGLRRGLATPRLEPSIDLFGETTQSRSSEQGVFRLL
jgi:hypothetical protein